MVERLKEAMFGKHGLKSATMLLMVTLFLSNVLGLLRNILLASRAHDLGQLDSYYAAFRLPDLIFNILILGAIASAFIPVYAQVHQQEGQDEADAMANTLLGNLLALMIVAIVALWFLMPLFIPLLVGNFTLSAQAETVHLARIMLLSPFFFALSYIAGGLLNAHRRFFAYSIAPLIYNTAIIVGALLLPYYGVRGVAWSVVFGALLHFLIQVPPLYRLGFRLNPRIKWREKNVGRIVQLTLPRTVSIVMAQVTLLGFTAIATRLGSGALSIFSLTNDFQTTPAIIFGASLATAVFPTLSSAAADQNREEYHNYLTRTLRASIFVLIPLTILVLILRAQIIRLYIGLGHNISWSETIRAINALAWFAASFIAQAVTFILARAFYALQDTKRPMYASVAGTVVTLILAYTLPHTAFFAAHRNDVAALACAYSIGMWVQCIMLLSWLSPSWRGSLGGVWGTVAKTTVISLFTGLATWIVLRLVGEGLHLDTLGGLAISGIGTNTILRLFTQAASAFLAGLLTFLLLAYSLKSEEMRWIVSLRKRNDA